MLISSESDEGALIVIFKPLPSMDVAAEIKFEFKTFRLSYIQRHPPPKNNSTKNSKQLQ